MSDCPYDSDYFLRGKESGKSLFENYRWLPELTIPMVMAMVRHLKIKHEHTVLDFGCARGYTVKALRQQGFKAFGVDCSPWAIENCDPEVRQLVYLDTKPRLQYDWIIAKDVLEHVEAYQDAIDSMMCQAAVGVFVVVPLGGQDGSPLINDGRYVIPEYEQDVTHRWRWTLAQWAAYFMRPGWEVTASYRVKGVKDNWYRDGWEKGNGFLICRRINS